MVLQRLNDDKVKKERPLMAELTRKLAVAYLQELNDKGTVCTVVKVKDHEGDEVHNIAIVMEELSDNHLALMEEHAVEVDE